MAGQPTQLDDLLELLQRGFATGDMRHELSNLRAIKRWALAQLGIDYSVGDRVVIAAEGIGCDRDSGWWCYREALAKGATAVVRDIDFNAHHGIWQAAIVLDRQWSVHEPLARDGATVRHWQGPVEQTPEGYEPPHPHNVEHNPDGRKGLFCLCAEQLALAPHSKAEA